MLGAGVVAGAEKEGWGPLKIRFKINGGEKQRRHSVRALVTSEFSVQ